MLTINVSVLVRADKARPKGNEFMALSPRQKKTVMKKHQRHDKDSGSAEVQIALLTKKIDKLVKHLKTSPKDNHSRRGLLGMISQRKKLMKHLKNKDDKKYAKVIKELNLKG